MAVNPLVKAAKRGDLRTLKNAIESGADLNGEDSQGWTPLFHAAHRGWTEGLKAIIDAGADVNHGKEHGFTALFSAVSSGRIEIVQMLLDAGAQVRDMGGITLTGYARGTGRPEIVALIERATQNNSPND